MSKKSEERKAKNKKIVMALSCILGGILAADIIVCIVAFLNGDTKVAVGAFLALFVIVPLVTVLVDSNIDFSSTSFPWFID